MIVLPDTLIVAVIWLSLAVLLILYLWKNRPGKCERCGSREIVGVQNVEGKKILLCHVCADGLCSDHVMTRTDDSCGSTDQWMWVKNE